MPAHSHHHNHRHDHTPKVTGRNERRILLALWLTGGFMLAEVVGGVLSGSLALLADAAHMLLDTAALGLALVAFRFSNEPADSARTYGYQRLPVLAAFANGISLLFIVGWITIEAVDRLLNPAAVLAGPMLIVAVLGLVVNIVAFIVLQGADRNNLNIRGAAVHVLGDMLGSVAAIAAALVIFATGWVTIDPILSVLVAALVLRSGWSILKDSAHVLLEGVPENVHVAEIAPDLVRHITTVEDIHHVHAWSLAQDNILLTLHARVCAGADSDAAIAAINQRLGQRFGIEHVTVQIEMNLCADEAVPSPGSS